MTNTTMNTAATANTAEKMTKAKWFARIKEAVEASEMENKEGAIQFIEHELALLAKKKSGGVKTPLQRENETIKETILEVLADFGEGVTVTKLMTDARLASYSNQKLTSLLSQLTKSGEVVRVKDKKTTLFSLVETAE